MKRLEGNVVNLTALVTLVALFLLIIGGSQSEEDSTTESQPGATKSAGVSDTTTEHDFEPTYIGGYPTEETAAAMFDEYDYQAATQFYIWAYAYLNNMGMEKGFAKMGGDERSFYIFDKRIQPQHILMTANSEVVYNWTRFIDLSKGWTVSSLPLASGEEYGI